MKSPLFLPLPFVVSLLPTAILTTAIAQTSTPAASQPSLAAAYGRLPLRFEANEGQSDPRVKFLSSGNGYSLFLTDSSAVLVLSKREHNPRSAEKNLPPGNTSV
ncbi:MAG TPA: hypothetical protein VHT28_00260, partial [Silvibacterium sp.]|nr:hypothetical protein [Silvibacterium sp.]